MKTRNGGEDVDEDHGVVAVVGGGSGGSHPRQNPWTKRIQCCPSPS